MPGGADGREHRRFAKDFDPKQFLDLTAAGQPDILRLDVTMDDLQSGLFVGIRRLVRHDERGGDVRVKTSGERIALSGQCVTTMVGKLREVAS